MNDEALTGSIDFAQLCAMFKDPRYSDLFKTITKKDGSKACYINFIINKRKEPKTFQRPDGYMKTFTHTMKVSLPKEKRETLGNIYLGDLETLEYEARETIKPTEAPKSDDLPF